MVCNVIRTITHFPSNGRPCSIRPCPCHTARRRCAAPPPRCSAHPRRCASPPSHAKTAYRTSRHRVLRPVRVFDSSVQNRFDRQRLSCANVGCRAAEADIARLRARFWARTGDLIVADRLNSAITPRNGALRQRTRYPLHAKEPRLLGAPYGLTGCQVLNTCVWEGPARCCRRGGVRRRFGARPLPRPSRRCERGSRSRCSRRRSCRLRPRRCAPRCK